MSQQNIILLQLGKRCSNFYEKKILDKIKDYSSFHLIKYYTNFEEINKHLPYQFNYLIPKLSSVISNLKHHNISKIMMPNITLHHTSDKLKENVLFIHPINETINKMNQINIKEAYLFGSIYTMNNEELKQKFNSNNINILSIDKEDQIFVDDFRKKTYSFLETETEKNKYQKVLKKYLYKNSIIIACTELSIFTPTNKKNIFDTAYIQIDKIFTNLKNKK